VAVFEALDYHNAQSFPRMDEVLDAFKAGLAAYRARDFVAAQRFFSVGAAANEDEKPSRLYFDRCRHYLASPPPADWDGVWVLTEK
jgi:adenylate cyclase